MKKEEIDKIRKKLIYNAKYRGSKESEIILDTLCSIINNESENQKLHLIEKFLSESDNDIFNWFFDLPKNKSEYKNLIEKIKLLIAKK